MSLMKGYVNGSEYADKITLRADSPFTRMLLSRIWDDWYNTSLEHNRWKIMQDWVAEYKSGASEEEMLRCDAAARYASWWSHKGGKSSKEVADRTVMVAKMIANIASCGYSEDGWDKKPGWKPIRVSVDATGIIYTYDGAHRTMILAALGMDIPTRIEVMKESFYKAITSISLLYQPSSHPCVHHLRVNRKGLDRYAAVSDELKRFGIKSVCEIGCAEGEGLTVLAESGASVMGVENEEARFLLANSLCIVTKAGVARRSFGGEYGACVGLSVWHHLAKDLASLNEWIDKTKRSPVQFVEMPEQGSKTFQQGLIDDTGWPWEEVGERIKLHVMSKGGYSSEKVIFVDEKYANRKTVMLSR